MKLSAVFAVLAAAAASVSAVAGETNAQRMARGLPPLPPVRKATRVGAARRAVPSGTPPNCNSGNVQCCNTLTTSQDPVAQLLGGLLGIVLGSNANIGLNCSPVSSGSTCSQHTVCCDNNSFNGLIALGCTAINLSL